ncbi:hypothetical protein MOUN0_L07954 [Monosporozyma unispora]
MSEFPTNPLVLPTIKVAKPFNGNTKSVFTLNEFLMALDLKFDLPHIYRSVSLLIIQKVRSFVGSPIFMKATKLARRLMLRLLMPLKSRLVANLTHMMSAVRYVP